MAVTNSCIETLVLQHDVCFDGKYAFVGILAMHAAIGLLCVLCGWLVLCGGVKRHVETGAVFVKLLLITVASGVAMMTWRLSEDGWGHSMGFSTAVNMTFFFLGLLIVDLLQRAFPWRFANRNVTMAATLIAGVCTLYEFGVKPFFSDTPTKHSTACLVLCVTPGFLVVQGYLGTCSNPRHHSFFVTIILSILTMITVSHVSENRFFRLSVFLGSLCAPLFAFSSSFVVTSLVSNKIRHAWMKRSSEWKKEETYGTF